MGIINDVLKKIQQGQAAKAAETPALPAAPAPPASGYLYSNPAETTMQDEQPPIEYLPSSPNKYKPVFALLCAMSITVGASGFLFQQVNTYFPKIKKSATSSFYKLIHKKEQPDFKTRAPADLVPLAKISVNPPKPLNPPGPALTPAISDTIKPNGPPETLNIHGVMSNGPNNVVLINDQVYQEGDEVEGVKIVKINMDYITVVNNGIEQKIFVKN